MGCQTQDSEKQKDSLQDMVSAFLMQNKFLNKEVLELNQLRQQGNSFNSYLQVDICKICRYLDVRQLRLLKGLIVSECV